MKSANGPNPSAIMALSTGYWNSAVMLAAVKLRLFDILADGPQTASHVTSALRGDDRAVSMLLDACAALNLLERSSEMEGAAYANTPAADTFLVFGRPSYIGSAIVWSADQYAAWGNLAETVLSGRPAVSPDLHLGADPAATRAFVLGMHNRAIGLARSVVQFVDLDGCASLLDVGGGPGTYAVLLAEKYASMQATVFDLPGVLEVAADLISSSGAADRVSMRAGNAAADEYGNSEFDAVLFSGVLHQFGSSEIREMLSKASRALKPGGRVIICDIMLDETRTSPPFAALFSVQMLLTSHDGAVFAASDVGSWLTEAGFDQLSETSLPPPLPYVLVTARIPG